MVMYANEFKTKGKTKINCNIYLADLLKTILTKFAVIWVKMGHKRLRFFAPEKLEDHINEGRSSKREKDRA